MTIQETSQALAPAVGAAQSFEGAIRVRPLTCAIGAELGNVDLGAASRDPALVAQIRALLLQHKVLFFRDQGMSRAEHVAFARHFGELEDHPVAGSDPEHPGLVRIYKSPDAPADRYENAWHTDATWRQRPRAASCSCRHRPATSRSSAFAIWACSRRCSTCSAVSCSLPQAKRSPAMVSSNRRFQAALPATDFSCSSRSSSSSSW